MTYLLKIFLLYFSISEASRLNAPRLLLPVFESVSTSFILSGSADSCYKWSTSRSGIVQLTLLDVNHDTNCASKVLVRPITKQFTRNTLLVLAEDVNSGEILRSSVIVDVISTIRIWTNTKQIYLNDVPGMFKVVAYDLYGNEFDALEGIEFDWRLANLEKHSNELSEEILQFISFADSLYEAPTSIELLEKNKRKGHIILVEGVVIGSGKVSVRLMQPEYKNVQPDLVIVTVLTKFIISPSSVYLLQGDTVELKLFHMQDGDFHAYSLYNSRYVMKALNDTIVNRITDSDNVIEGLQFGQTKIQLYNQYSAVTDDDISQFLPSSVVTVDKPSFLNLIMLPYNSWILTEFENSTISVEIFNLDNKQFHIGPYASVNIAIDGKYFHTIERTSNGTYITGWPLLPGVVRVQASFESVKNLETNQAIKYDRITTEAELVIFSRVIVKPNLVYLPWDNGLSHKSFDFIASGGDNMYQWTSDNSDVASVFQAGVLNVRGIGSCSITVSMERKRNNKDSARVHVLPVASLKIFYDNLHAKVNTPIRLYVALYGNLVDQETTRQSPVPFTSCSYIPFEVSFSVASDVHYEMFSLSDDRSNNDGNESRKDACIGIAVTVSTVITTEVEVSYKVGSSVIKDSVVISTFSPLTLSEPASGQTVLAVGSLRHVVYKVSWNPSAHREILHNIRMINSDERVLDVAEIYKPNTGVTSDNYLWFVYSVLCKSLGESWVSVNVDKTDQNDERAKLKVICAIPKSVQLTASFLTSIHLKDCPLSARSTSGTWFDDSDVKIGVTIKDEFDRIFDNATSLKVSWSISKPSLATVKHPNAIMLNEDVRRNIYTVPMDHYQIIVPNKLTGVIKLTASVSIIPPDTTRNQPSDILKIKSGGNSGTLDGSFILSLVDEQSVTPNVVSLLNNPKRETELRIVQGSGYFKVSPSGASSSDVVSIRYSERNNTIQITPKSSGSIKLMVQDLCLDSKPSEIDITILTVDRIDVQLESNKLETGHSTTATLNFYYTNGNALVYSDLKMFDVKAIVSTDDVLSLNLLEPEDDDDDENGIVVQFSVTAVKEGVAKVTFSAELPDVATIFFSKPVTVEVYPSLTLSPSNITALPGMELQIFPVGGPAADTNRILVYSVDDDRVIKVNDNGVVETLTLGRAVITAVPYVSDKLTGKKITYAKAVAYVHVVELEGVRIKVPLTNIKVGAKMPAWIEGVPQQLTPLIIGSVTPSFQFTWTTTSPSVINIYNVFRETGFQVRSTDTISMRIKALKTGSATVSVNVTVPSSEKFFEHSIVITVLEDIKIMGPQGDEIKSCCHAMVSPQTSFEIKTNDDYEYQLCYGSVDLVEHKRHSRDDNKIVSVLTNGLVVTRDEYGISVIEVINDNNRISNAASSDLLVEVKPTHYMMINVEPTLYHNTTAKKHLGALSRGMKLQFHVSYHDSMGLEFAYVKSFIRHEFNRLDQISLSRKANNNLEVNLLKNGETIVKIWEVRNSIMHEDYVKLSTATYVSPSEETLTVGDVVCFSLSFWMNVPDGVWSSDNVNALVIDSTKGIAIAQKSRDKVNVNYAQNDVVVARTHFSILPLQKVLIIPFHKRSIINNDNPNVFELILHGEGQHIVRKSNNLFQAAHCSSYSVTNFPFHCEVQFESRDNTIRIEEVFNVKPHFDFNTGLYNCILEKTPDSELKASHIHSNILFNVVWEDKFSETRVINFTPAVYVYPREISISCYFPETMFYIKGLPHVLEQIKITTSKITLFAEKKLTDGDLKIAVYMIDSIEESDVDFNITVTSALTEQVVNIKVKANSFWYGKTTCKLHHLKKGIDDSNIPLIWLLGFILFISTLYYVFYSRGRERTVINPSWEPPPSTDAHRRSHTTIAGNQHLQLPSSARNLQRLDNTHRQIESNLLHKRISTLPSSPQYQGQPNLSYTSPFAFQRSPTSSPTLYPRTSTRIDSQRQRQNDDASPRNRSPYLRTHDYT